MSDIADHFLDITADLCPMTFVKAKLLIEKMKTGETAEVRLTGAENVPRSVAEAGHEIVGLVPDRSDPAGAVHILTLRKV